MSKNAKKRIPKHIITEQTRLINGFKFDIVATHLDSWSTIRLPSSLFFLQSQSLLQIYGLPFRFKWRDSTILPFSGSSGLLLQQTYSPTGQPQIFYTQSEIGASTINYNCKPIRYHPQIYINSNNISFAQPNIICCYYILSQD